MAEDDVSTNGHRPARRQRKRIYPPAAQMAAEQAAAAARPPRPSRRSRTAVAEPELEREPEFGAEPDFGPEPAASPAPPAMTAMASSPDADLALAESEDGGALEGERVELRLSAVGMVDAGDVSFSQGALGAARAENVAVDKGAVGAAFASNVELSRGYARSILARQVQLDRAAARIVVAADVKAERSAVMFLVARRVTGDVRVLLDWRGAAAFGAVAGIILAILRWRPGGRDKASSSSRTRPWRVASGGFRRASPADPGGPRDRGPWRAPRPCAPRPLQRCARGAARRRRSARPRG